MSPRLGRNSRRWLIALVLAAAVCTDAGADDASVMSKSAVGPVGGTEVYTHICQGCHMRAAQGAVGAGHFPKLAGTPALVSWQYVAITVLNGKNGMPAFGRLATGDPLDFLLVHLSDAQVADVVNYVRGNFGNHYQGGVTAEQVAGLPHPGTR